MCQDSREGKQFARLNEEERGKRAVNQSRQGAGRGSAVYEQVERAFDTSFRDSFFRGAHEQRSFVCNNAP